MITLYNSDAITEICTLDNCLECLVTEEENGVFELELTYSISSNNFSDIQNNKVIKTKASDELGEQLFRIYYVSNEIDGKIYVKAQHITYDLIDNFVENITCTNSTCQNSFQTMLSKCQHSHKFKGYSDIEHIGTYNLSRVNALEAILGTKGSLLDTYGNGAKLKRDNYNIYLNKTRGSNNGVTISYSKNITGYKREIDETGLVTCIYPFAKVQKELGEDENVTTVEETIILPERFINSKYVNNYPHPKILAVDYSEREVKDIASLRTQANKYFNETQRDVPNVNYKVEFVYLHQTLEYEENNLKALELVGMGDTVTVIDERIGMNVEANVIKTVFNVLTDRYESIELGRFKNSINDIIGDLESSVDNALTQVNNMYVNFEVLDDKIISEVSKLEGDIKVNSTLIEQTDSYIQSVATDLNGKYTSIKQTVDSIDLTGKVNFSDLSNKGGTVIHGGNISTGTITADKIASNAITADKIASNTITVDKISSNNENPIIKLFNNCSIDATKQYEQGKGTSIRLKWDENDYLKVGSDTFEFYNTSAGEQPCLRVYGGTGTTYFVTPTKTLMINSTGLHVDGTHVSLSTHNHNGVYAPYTHTHNYASSSHNHSGETIKPYNVSPSRIGDGNAILMHSSLDGNGKNLGYSGSKFNQVSAFAVWGDQGSWSDIKTKENIRYLDDETKVISENDISNKLELFDFIKNIKICEYNYKEEFKFKDETNNKIGFIANDVVGDKIGDKIVAEHEGYLTYNLNNMLFTTIGALQEEIKIREEENKQLRERLDNIEKTLLDRK